jgi:hypothetical protein
MGLSIDHLILGVNELDRGIRSLRLATGITPEFGGVHPGRGRQNALMSLGRGCYLELLAPNPRDTAADPSQSEFLKPLERPTPIAWAVRSDSLEQLRLGLIEHRVVVGEMHAGARARADGSRLSWRTLTPWAAANGIALGLLPFFIQWDDLALHPSRTAPAGCRLERFELLAADPVAIQTALSAADVSVPIRPSPRDALIVTLAAPAGRVVFEG